MTLNCAICAFGGTPFVPASLPSDPSVVVASIAMDVNQDGKMDLVTVQNAGTVNVLLGDGNFSDLKVTSSIQLALLNDVYYIFATTADMNKDGYPDLIVTDEINNAAFVYINAKNGTFLPPVEYDFSSRPVLASIPMAAASGWATSTATGIPTWSAWPSPLPPNMATFPSRPRLL